MNMVSQRRYDLDWIRVLAFGLLIFYHIGMFFNSEGWHVKSPHMNDTVDNFMWLSSPFRLSLLFLISGVALRFALDKATSHGAFARKRFVRLFVTIAFGMAVVVTPQAYFELLGKGEIDAGYLDFWVRYLAGDESYSITVPTWNHLWYVVYLLVYSLLAILFMPLVRWLAGLMDRPWFERLMGEGRLFVLPAALFIFWRFTTDMHFPEKHNFWGDWGAHARYGSYFVIGLLLAKNRTFWQLLAQTWKIAAVGTLLLAVSLSLLWANWDAWFGGITWVENIVRAMRPLYAWMIIMAILGAGQAYLNKPSALLTYLTEAVFPYYILHQSLIVVAGVYIAGFGFGVWLEFALILLATFAGCVLTHEYIIRRVSFLRPLFGVPMWPQKDAALPQPRAAE